MKRLWAASKKWWKRRFWPACKKWRKKLSRLSRWSVPLRLMILGYLLLGLAAPFVVLHLLDNPDILARLGLDGEEAVNGRPAVQGITTWQKVLIAGGVVTLSAAIIGLVISYRRQRDAEDTKIKTEFANAAAQLGSDSASVRIAGVYAMAAIADSSRKLRQQCIDVLCGHIRLPYNPDVGNSSQLTRTETRQTYSSTYAETSTFHQVPGEREVRFTIIRVIRDHLQPDADKSWRGYDFDFTGAVFEGCDFSGAQFRNGCVSFRQAQFMIGATIFYRAVFSGEEVSFEDAQFSGEWVSFGDAEFSGEWVTFAGAQFSGGQVSFDGARFSGEWVSFGDAEFSGEWVTFAGANFSGERINFRDAQFSGGQVSFDGARFSGEHINFSDAQFSDGKVIFRDAEFSGGEIDFWGAEFSGGWVGFGGAEFSGGQVSFWGARFLGGWVSFGEAKFLGESVSFKGARFSGGKVSFLAAEFSKGKVNFGGAECLSGGHVDFRYANFSGSEVQLDRSHFLGGIVDLRKPLSWRVPPKLPRPTPQGLYLPAHLHDQ